MSLIKKPKTDFAALRDLMKRNAPHWMILDTATDRQRIAGRVYQWNHNPPQGFEEGGFVFRSRKEHDGPGGYLLEGRYIGTEPAPY